MIGVSGHCRTKNIRSCRIDRRPQGRRFFRVGEHNLARRRYFRKSPRHPPGQTHRRPTAIRARAVSASRAIRAQFAVVPPESPHLPAPSPRSSPYTFAVHVSAAIFGPGTANWPLQNGRMGCKTTELYLLKRPGNGLISRQKALSRKTAPNGRDRSAIDHDFGKTHSKTRPQDAPWARGTSG